MRLIAKDAKQRHRGNSKDRLRPYLWGAAALTFGIISMPAQAAPEARTTLQGHFAPAMLTAQVVGPLAGDQPVSLLLTLPLRNQAALQDLLRGLYDPKDPRYGKYLTSAEFTERFAPTQADYDAVANFARQQGFKVTGTHANRTVLDVSGLAAVAQKTFGVKLIRLQGMDGRIFRAPDREPSVPESMGKIISSVQGLDDSIRLHTNIHPVLPGLTPGMLSPFVSGTGPGGNFSPADTKKAYSLNTVSQTGSGQVLGVFELDGYLASDITNYTNQFGLPAVTLQNVLVDGGPGALGGGQAEVTLDIDLLIAMAPNASKIVVYEAPNGSGILDCYTRIATDNLAKSISTSWGTAEANQSTSFRNAENTQFQQMAAQGQSMFAASGDSGAYDNGSTLSVDDPASQPWMTAVGGTDLSVNGAGGTYNSESAWGFAGDTRGSAKGAGSGGGSSTYWSIPSYQVGVGSGSSLASTTKRNVPDVSIYGDYDSGGYAINLNGSWAGYNGTSAAAPLWAGFAGLVNQARAAAGYSTIGFINTPIYQIGQGSHYATDFHDVNNGTTNLFFPAVTGYDLATGWGSPIGSALLADLTAPVSAPTNLAATAGNASVSLSWTASTNAISYSLYRSTTSGGEGATPIASGISGTTFNNTGLTNGTTYYYKVAAVSAGFSSAQSTEASATPVATAPIPADVTATAGVGSVSVNWTASTGATSYNVYRSTTSGGEGTTPLATGVTAIPYLDSSVSNGTKYYYKVAAVNAGGTSAQSSEASATPLAAAAVPTGLTATAGNAQVSLAWNSSVGASTYNVYRGTAAGAEGASPIVTGLASPAYVDSTVTNGTTYYYKVAAVNAVSTSAQSTEAVATPLGTPLAPAGLTATPGNTQATLNWSTSAMAATYNVYRGTTAGGENATPIATGITGTTYVNTGLTNGTTYYYKVAAVNSQGTSPLSTEASAKPAVPVAAPATLTATPSISKVILGWSAVSGATSYNVYRSTTSGGEGTTPLKTGIGGTSYSDTTTVNGTTYYYTVAAVSAAGTSPQSVEASATPQTPPTYPHGLTATAGDGQIILAWTASAGATSYNVLRSTTSGGEGTTPIATGITGTSYVNTGLTNGTAYYYKMTATGPTGTSTASAEVHATPYTLVLPATSAALSGTSGNSPWYVSAVQVTLTATAGTFPITHTYYTIDGGAQTTYTTPFTITDGSHTVVYWSADNAGNSEATHTQAIQVDTVAPATRGSVTGTTVTLTPSDSTSGVASTLYTIDGGAAQTYASPFSITAYGSHTVTYYSVDAAGNTETSQTLTVTNNYPAPAITSSLPASGTAGGPAFTFKINGSGFTSGTTVMFGSFAVTPSAQTATLLTMTIPAADITTAGVVTVTVSNPAPGGGSATTTFTVNPPTLLLTSFSPTSVAGGVSTTGRVQLTAAAPAGGLVINISSSDSTVMTLPSSTVTVPAGAVVKTFTVTTHAVASTQSPVLTATYGTVTKTATLTVTGP